MSLTWIVTLIVIALPVIFVLGLVVMSHFDALDERFERTAKLTCHHCGQETSALKKICEHCSGELQ